MPTTLEILQEAASHTRRGVVQEFLSRAFWHSAGIPVAGKSATPAVLALTPRSRRQSRDQAMRDLGLTKVRGNLGGTYWE